MASIKNLKKDINYVLGDIIEECYTWEMLNPKADKKATEKIIDEAKARSYSSISLETGSDNAFRPAIALYEKYGFEECGPFAGYKLDPYSLFYTKKLIVNERAQ